jgi:hypothetical protein
MMGIGSERHHSYYERREPFQGSIVRKSVPVRPSDKGSLNIRYSVGK